MFSLFLFCRLIFLVLLSKPFFLEGARILSLFPVPSPSHFHYVLPYLKNLASLGHEITSVSPYHLKAPVSNIREILLPEVFDSFEDFIKAMTTPKSKWEYYEVTNEFVYNITKVVLNNEEIQLKILKKENVQFDLIIVDLWKYDALYGFAAYFNAPLIGVAPCGTDWKVDELVGNVSPISYLQSPSSYFYDLETYGGRLAYFMDQSLSWINWHWRFAKKHEALYKKYFPKIVDKQPLSKIVRNFSLVLVNQHFTLGPPRPYVPNVIEVGGMHINQATKALPKELEDFIQGAGEHGVIYFSLGTNVKTESLSEDRKKILIETFESLPQRVLWKFEDDELPVRLFITHGGMQSTIESIYFGKPMLGLPFFYDQFGNMEHIKRKGLGLVLNFKDMTKDQFRDSIHRLLTEKSFEELARKTSSQYHDQPMKPRETAIWWTHYVLRHKGAPNMQVAGRKLNFFIYHSLDVLCTLLLAFVVILAVVVIFVINVLEMILGRQIEKNPIKLKTY
ncbi:UDP-glycosyltransferase UGT5-like isoform X2 [Drosophila ficusphila]|uniref:UDP-glycosyltransferase UGT5-like isoform X2 n=1 Tax=Drosophila ficusphila TaxID=30025 RepID=UPI001C89A12C|nr:UDP-glycosyltransferase UGT5-like isoform X2 [Drosophila ficusphila]